MIKKLNNVLAPKAGEISKLGGALGASQAAVVAEIAVDANTLVVVFTPDFLTAARLEEELCFFLPTPPAAPNSTATIVAPVASIPIINFPDWETLPYDNFSPPKDIISQRLAALYNLPNLRQGIVILPIATALHRLCPPEYLLQNVLMLATGDKFDITAMRSRLQAAGYHCVGQVAEHGEFAVRGSILDLFSMGSEQPLRIDVFADEIDSMRYFDPDTQRSADKIERINLLPAHEFGFDEASISYFRRRWREQFPGDQRHYVIYDDVSQGIIHPGLEYYLPLFFPQLATIFAYLPQDSWLISLGDIGQASADFWQQIKQRYDQYGHDVTKPLLAPEQLFIPSNEFFHYLKQYPRYSLSEQRFSLEKNNREKISQEKFSQKNLPVAALPQLNMDIKLAEPLQNLQNFISSADLRVLICAETVGRREILHELLTKHQINPTLVASWQEFLQGEQKLALTVTPLAAGMLIDPTMATAAATNQAQTVNSSSAITANKLAVIAEADILGHKAGHTRHRKLKAVLAEAMIRNLAELTIGTAVVHIEHGVGRYIGLNLLTIGGEQAEYITLEYADGAKLYVPVTEMQLLSRYSSADLEHAPLHQLGSDKWQKDKQRAIKQATDAAAELLIIYAKRAQSKGYSFPPPDLHYEQFIAGFPFEETTEQQQAIQQVIQDLTADTPMDRVICGDVGFGKTEVALRAAFLVLQAGKQVAVLVPTTLLAQQHYQTFVDRFADFPFQIQVLSRFKTAAEQKTIIADLANGKCDLVIGTHKLLQREVKFNNLGLLIIDEEHRFGVKQKEKFKAMRSEVDILTLTATPIPRTLNMAMASIRDLSIISTPPARRLAVKTLVREYQKPLIAEAVLREIRRGGQVYYLHNEVSTIQHTAEKLHDLISEARIAVAHGKMPERELEHIMADFYHRRYNLLVCTTIIETGIDIPTANTIVIERADKFGLAQLHQLRGRVGRSHHQAYAFCLTPHHKLMTKDAIKRLEALESLETLGAGFMLANHDLEIRGAGELLGEAQSGNIQAIGFSMYMELLEHAVKMLKTGEPIDYDFKLNKGVEIDLQLPILIPESYVPDVQTRLVLYKRIASAESNSKLDELQIELIDRFGLLPQQTKYLFKVTELKLQCEQMRIVKIKIGKTSGNIKFQAKPNINPEHIIKLVQTEPKHYQFVDATSIKFYREFTDKEHKLAFVAELLAKLRGE